MSGSNVAKAFQLFVPGCLVDARPIGILSMEDSGESDAKVLAVPAKDPRFKEINDISKIEPHILEEIQHFFKVYKELQNKPVKVGDWEGRDATLNAIKRSLLLYNEKYPK